MLNITEKQLDRILQLVTVSALGSSANESILEELPENVRRIVIVHLVTARVTRAKLNL